MGYLTNLYKIYRGLVANDETGTPARTAAEGINNNMDALNNALLEIDTKASSKLPKGTYPGDAGDLDTRILANANNFQYYILLSDKGQPLGVASLDSNGKLPAGQLPDLAITSVKVAVETTLADFAANSANYTFEEGDVIVIIDTEGNESHYIFKGGTKTDVNSYSQISAGEILISQVQGLQAALDGKANDSEVVDVQNTLSNHETRITALEGAATLQEPISVIWNTGDPLIFSLPKTPSAVDINGKTLSKWKEDGVTSDEWSVSGSEVTLIIQPVDGDNIQFHFNNSASSKDTITEEVFVLRTVENPAWQNESSTFTGWGSAIGKVSEFDSVNVKIRGFDASFPIANIRVRIRENDYNGAILGTKLMPVSEVGADNILNVKFDTSINSSSNLWIEYLTDGRIGLYNETIDFGQGTVVSKYTTSANVDGTVSSPVSGGTYRAIWAEFFKETEVPIPTAEEFIPEINLPDKISSVVGYKQQLFYRGMIQAIDPYQWNIKITGDVGGKQFPRYYEFTPATAGTKTFTISLYNSKDELVTTASTTVEFLTPVPSPASLKKVLCVGDSLTAGGIWTGELLRMITGTGGTPEALNLSNIEFIGTQGSGANRHEGYGGKKWSWFNNPTTAGDIDVEFTVASHDKQSADLVSIWQDANGNQWTLEAIVSGTVLSFSRLNHTNPAPDSGSLTHVSGATNTSDVVYSSVSGGAVNPFWNASTGQLDFANYITSNGFGSLDYAFILLTWNELTVSSNIASAKFFLDTLHAQLPNVKVKLLGLQLPSLNGGLAANYGDATSDYGNYYELARFVFDLNTAYQDLANEAAYSSFVEFENVSAQFDNENNMPESDAFVNLRSSEIEKRGTTGVHPATAGYYQIADVAFRTFNTLI